MKRFATLLALSSFAVLGLSSIADARPGRGGGGFAPGTTGFSGPGAGGGGRSFGGGGISRGGPSLGSRNFGGNSNFGGNRNFSGNRNAWRGDRGGNRRGNRGRYLGYGIGAAALGYYGSNYYYGGGECSWLRRRAESTGSRYWWDRYEDCIN